MASHCRLCDALGESILPVVINFEKLYQKTKERVEHSKIHYQQLQDISKDNLSEDDVFAKCYRNKSIIMIKERMACSMVTKTNVRSR